MLRKEQVKAYADKAEKAKLKRMAVSMNCSQSEVIRALIRNHPEPEPTKTKD